MQGAVVCAPVRTLIGRFGGVLRGETVQTLAAAAVRGTLERAQHLQLR